eukprot:ANDGO_03264.mRNA.1 Protein TONNEAU 1b
MDNLKDLVIKTLESKGVLGRLKAELRSSVYNAIQAEADTENIKIAPSERAHALHSDADALFAAQMISEFLEFFGLQFSKSVFLPEVSIKTENTLSADDCRKQLGLDLASPSTQTEPVLLSLMHAYRNLKQYRYAANEDEEFQMSDDEEGKGKSKSSSAISTGISAAPSAAAVLAAAGVTSSSENKTKPSVVGRRGHHQRSISDADVVLDDVQVEDDTPAGKPNVVSGNISSSSSTSPSSSAPKPHHTVSFAVPSTRSSTYAVNVDDDGDDDDDDAETDEEDEVDEVLSSPSPAVQNSGLSKLPPLGATLPPLSGASSTLAPVGTSGPASFTSSSSVSSTHGTSTDDDEHGLSDTVRRQPPVSRATEPVVVPETLNASSKSADDDAHRLAEIDRKLLRLGASTGDNEYSDNEFEDISEEIPSDAEVVDDDDVPVIRQSRRTNGSEESVDQSRSVLGSFTDRSVDGSELQHLDHLEDVERSASVESESYRKEDPEDDDDYF